MTTSYEIQTKPDPRHTNVKITGEVGPGGAGRVADDVMAIFARENTRRLLIDVRGLTISVNPVETVELVSSYAERLKGRSPAKTAVLYREGDYDTLRFYETVALNRSYQTAIFTNMDQAVEWLDV